MEEEKPAEEPEKPAEPADKPLEPAEPAEKPADESVEPVEDVPPAPKPRAVRLRKPKAKASAPSIVVPEINDKFWATLLRTQREAERATKLLHISKFNLI